MIKKLGIALVIIIYTAILLLAVIDFSLVIKYKYFDEISEDIIRTTDNIIMIALFGYYLSITIILLIFKFFKDK